MSYKVILRPLEAIKIPPSTLPPSGRRVKCNKVKLMPRTHERTLRQTLSGGLFNGLYDRLSKLMDLPTHEQPKSDGFHTDERTFRPDSSPSDRFETCFKSKSIKLLRKQCPLEPTHDRIVRRNPVRRTKYAVKSDRVGARYGPVYTLYFGHRPIVILNGYTAVKEALVDQGEEFSGRGRMHSVDKIFDGFGVVFSNGERWKQLRRFSLTTLRNFGMGKRSIEERIQEEAQCLIKELHNFKQKPVDPRNILVQAISNVICSVVFGNRFEYEDLKFLKLINLFNETFLILSSTCGQLQEIIPRIMDYVPGPHQRINPIMERLLVFVSERVKMNQASLDPSSPRDYIDCFITKMQQDNEDPASEFNMRNLLLTVLNLFFAGTETVSTTLRHGFLILLKYPEIQDKLQKEIDSVIGQNRSPSIEDRSKMPYMDAVIHEIQRFSDVIPMNVPHTVIRDTTFRGFTIPKARGTTSIPEYEYY
ncbi:hypothetical protein AB205_0132320 [Aquarana catesbeiana]|uniref:Cytochrome P450 2G1 n=1 Tax=Aquarana catesbeiana TaxID=8400 RepID=A0A2G9RSV7_AQUCT|nr:hypothetical protein AB205_0132320 [Aquarana catesbeiana]